MYVSNATRVASREILCWVQSMRENIVEWVEPGTEDYKGGMRPIFVDIKYLRKKEFIAVPFIGYWRPNVELVVDPQILKKFRTFYGIGFDYDKESVFSAPSDPKSIFDLLRDSTSHCAIFPRDEKFVIINSNLDYWIVAGQVDFVKAFCPKSITESFEDFIEIALEWEDQFEAGAIFVKFIHRLYMKHNVKIMQAN